MNITTALRLEDSNCLIAWTDDNTRIDIMFYQTAYELSVRPNDISFSLCEGDELYEPITKETFMRALKLVNHRINNTINKL